MAPEQLSCLAPLIAPSPQVDESSELPTKEGVLFVRQGLLKQWRRCWCVLRSTTLSLFKLSSSADGQTRWRERPLAEIQLTLCNIKPSRAGGRFYLDVRSPWDHLTLQALSDAGMQSWVDAVQEGVAKAFGSSADGMNSPQSKVPLHAKSFHDFALTSSPGPCLFV